ncbi:hypothetical protein LCGC14_0840110 [marine sediment metagenome]|uniref:Uncharacterized protein n=1 Tax=marine sediment metagenome TaxID=412755 RepID=A0A0F9SKT2_9ZZZZ
MPKTLEQAKEDYPDEELHKYHFRLITFKKNGDVNRRISGDTYAPMSTVAILDLIEEFGGRPFSTVGPVTVRVVELREAK